MTTTIKTKEIMGLVKEFNAEVKSISGACKVIQAFWGKSEPIMRAIGIKQKNKVTPQNILALVADSLKETKEGGSVQCYMWHKVYDKVTTKSKTGAKVQTTYKIYKGKKVYTWEKIAVSSWTVATMLTLLEQSANQGAMPEYSKELAKYHKAIQSAKVEPKAVAKVEESKAKASDKAKAKASNKAKKAA